MPQAETGRTAGKAQRLDVTSTAFHDGEAIPTKYTADGENVSPPLRWSDPPPSTESIAVICEDPDAPSGVLVHWTAWNIGPGQHELPEAMPTAADVDGGIRQGKNAFGRTGYGGPKPPPGKPHRYRFRVFALDVRPNSRAGSTRTELERAIAGHVLAEGVLVGKYAHPR
jgi:Raf kinase inhibitor-like YbhB/YbcL family protein